MDFLLILRGIGLAMALGGLAMFTSHRQRRKQWSSAIGRVIENQRPPGPPRRQSRAVCPVVEFVTANGKRVRFTSSTAAWPPRYQIGARAKVLHHPENPEEAILDDKDASWLAPAILSGMGLIVTYLSFSSL